jgi:hypothetical protein
MFSVSVDAAGLSAGSLSVALRLTLKLSAF